MQKERHQKEISRKSVQKLKKESENQKEDAERSKNTYDEK